MDDNNVKIAVLQEQMNNVEKKVDIGFRITEKRFDAMEKIITEFVNTADSRYATKQIEKIIWAIGSSIGLAVLGAVLSLVILDK